MLRLVLGRLSSNATALPINACSTQPQEWYGLGPPLIPSHPILLFGCRLSCFELGTCGVCVFQGGGPEPNRRSLMLQPHRRFELSKNCLCRSKQHVLVAPQVPRFSLAECMDRQTLQKSLGKCPQTSTQCIPERKLVGKLQSELAEQKGQIGFMICSCAVRWPLWHLCTDLATVF